MQGNEFSISKSFSCFKKFELSDSLSLTQSTIICAKTSTTWDEHSMSRHIDTTTSVEVQGKTSKTLTSFMLSGKTNYNEGRESTRIVEHHMSRVSQHSKPHPEDQNGLSILQNYNQFNCNIF